MTQEKFIKILEEKKYSYEREGDEILVTHQGSVNLPSLESLSADVQFQNQGDVYLHSLESLPPGVQFQNQGYVFLSSLQSLPPGVQFQNQGNVFLSSLVGGWFNKWSGNVKGINHKRLLNLMISKGVFL